MGKHLKKIKDFFVRILNPSKFYFVITINNTYCVSFNEFGDDFEAKEINSIIIINPYQKTLILQEDLTITNYDIQIIRNYPFKTVYVIKLTGTNDQFIVSDYYSEGVTIKPIDNKFTKWFKKNNFYDHTIKIEK